ncbi:keratin, type II cytoskeletal 7-like [Sinocyclocheilus rhinocerous]|uniref:keratin, type II cytoskeletal 7-like n=1 Tax=Sinocyclocheilus rhinocerous TaxID=307959 RepID=UPI0007B7BDA3|nr:PREDICTED: keratin, type II cytoskeletal 7-like [Sinocyclocheilus rhinocerous]
MSSSSFSSRSVGSYPRAGAQIPRQGNSYFGFGSVSPAVAPIRAVSVNTSLLTPVDLQLDPDLQAVRIQEKEEIKTLNNRFASFIDKFDLISSQADQCNTELKDNKGAIADLKRQITRLQKEIISAKSQRESVEEQIKEAGRWGEEAVLDAKEQIKSLEDALQKAKHKMTRHIRDYQELMNVKLALDIEIATYKKLLEGEEDR